MKRIIVAIVSLGLLVGCAASSHIITGKTRPPIDPGKVRLYDHPPARFEEIGIIEASSRNSWAVTDQGKVDVVIARLKAEAAKLGANGVLLQTTGSESTGGVVIGSTTGSNPSFGTGIYTSALHKTGRALAIFIP